MLTADRFAIDEVTGIGAQLGAGGARFDLAEGAISADTCLALPSGTSLSSISSRVALRCDRPIAHDISTAPVPPPVD